MKPDNVYSSAKELSIMTVPPLVVILGADQPFTGTEPAPLIQTSGDRRALDWLLDAFRQSLSDPEIHFVGGYRIDDIVDGYPDIHFSRNEDWEDTGSVASLFTAPVPNDRPVYICYADTVFESTAVNELDSGDISIAIDPHWQTRYEGRSDESLARAEKVVTADNTLADVGVDIPVKQADAEFTGLTRLSPNAIEQGHALWESRTIDKTADLPTLLRVLDAIGIEIETVDIGGNWSELDTAEDLSRFILDTKANTLRRLRSMVTESVVLDQYSFTVGKWNDAATDITSAIEDYFNGAAVIVRSSAITEDGWEESNAGAFESILEVPSAKHQRLMEAIERVIDSYPDGHPDNQVLIQPMIEAPDQSGVVMTRALDGGSPYYVINYDVTTSSTESVTDGSGKHLRTAIVRKDLLEDDGTVPDELMNGSPSNQYPDDLALPALLRAIRELERIIGHDSLDIEFAIDKDGTVYILQTRPMTVDPAESTVDDETMFNAIDNARHEFQAAQESPPCVLGDRTVYGVMPDWNPAEIIGRQPRRLAASLYRYLIMNETWAKQRAEYGYRDVRPHTLMKQFAGQPYVDVRADFTSFIPASVPNDLAKRLVDYYLSRLEANPELHDKVEFDIALTCLPFDYDSQIEPLLQAGFTREELTPLYKGLEGINLHAYERIEDGTDEVAINHLQERYEMVVESDLPPLGKARHLLSDCRRLGTLPFAHLARTAFVATTLLRSLERTDVISGEEHSAFLNALNTVARQFEHDAYRVATGDHSLEAFYEKYGHLRPGTYELTSPRYDADPETYLQPMVENATEPEDHSNPREVWSEDTKIEVEAKLKSAGLPADVDRFVDFLVDAIEGREHSKFVFSRNLSEALEQLARFGEQHGFDREALSHVPIEDFFKLELDHPPADLETWLADRVREGRDCYTVAQSAELPPLLFEESDFLLFERPSREPNFVTSKTVTTEVIELTDANTAATSVDGKIILIPQADPGYDWLFGHDIAGLVTMYGGSNSHMAVRAAEFSLPAAIGVGENRYEKLQQADVLELNCGAQDIREVQ